MKKALYPLFLIPFIAFSLPGCVPLIVGGAVGAVGGYAVSKDTVQGDTDKPYDGLWSTAQEIAKTSGNVKKDDYSKGVIEYISQDSSLVWIRMTRLTRTASRVRVSSRRFHLPNLNLAQDVFVKMIEETK